MRTPYVDPADAERIEQLAVEVVLDSERPRAADILQIAGYVRTGGAFARVARALEIELQRGRPS